MGDWLTKPIKTGKTDEGLNTDLQYATCEIQGWKKSMEDQIMVHLNIGEQQNTHLFGVFDGHNGSEVASYAKDHFKDIFISLDSFKYKEYEQALKETFLKLDEQLNTPLGSASLRQYAEVEQAKEDCLLAESLCNQNSITLTQEDINQLKLFKSALDPRNLEECNIAMFSGCCACVCFFAENEIYFANVGNSKGVVYTRKDNDDIVLEAIVSNPNDPNEKKRIELNEEFIYDKKFNRRVTISRSIGDLQFKQNEWVKQEDQMVTVEPLVNKIDTEKGDFVIVACNGVWEKKEIANDIKGKMRKWKENDEGLKELLMECVEKNIPSTDPENGVPGYDNMSCVLINIKEKAKEKKEVVIPEKKGESTDKEEIEKKENLNGVKKKKKKEVVMEEIILDSEKDVKKEYIGDTNADIIN